MDKKSGIIGLIIAITLTIVILLGIGGINVVNASKIDNSIELGIEYLNEEKYEEAKLEFSNALSIDSDHEEAMELLSLTENYIQIESLYEDKEYIPVLELISEVKKNKHLVYIEKNLNEILDRVEKKISIINEVDNIDAEINKLIDENRYQEASDLVDRYLNEDLKEEYLNKLNELKNRINDSKVAYEEEQKRIEEERRIAEEKRISQEKRKLEEQQRAEEEKKIKEEQVNIQETNRQIWQMEALEMALDVVRSKHPGYGPHYWERGLVTEGEPRWAFIFLKLENPNAQNINDTEIIGKVGYTVNERTGEVKQEDWLVQ